LDGGTSQRLRGPKHVSREHKAEAAQCNVQGTSGGAFGEKTLAELKIGVKCRRCRTGIPRDRAEAERSYSASRSPAPGFGPDGQLRRDGGAVHRPRHAAGSRSAVALPNSSSNTVRRVSWKGLPRDADLPEILATDITRETSPARNTAGSACAWYALNVL
jgi:hypothetical protein